MKTSTYFATDQYLRSERFPALAGDLENEGGSIEARILFDRQDLTLSNGDNDDIAVTKRFVVIGGPTAAFAVTGFQNGEDGLPLLLFSDVTETMTIKDEAAGSTAANRITTLSGGDVTLGAGSKSFAVFIYDGTASRWILVTTN